MKTTCYLPEKTRVLWQLRCGIAAACLIAGVTVLGLLSLWMLIPAAVLAVLFAVFLFWFLPRYFRSYEIVFGDSAVIINRGVFFRSSSIMPYPRLVYASSFASPLARSFGLACVTLRAARGWFIIPEMEAEDAVLVLAALAGGEDL